ncbi:cytochrome P450 [Lentzea sp. E54]|uniref:cytochrome P450 n=1 Tax=Lentzea xerophila TaxID=3435883 RepID=UPI003DA2F877
MTREKDAPFDPPRQHSFLPPIARISLGEASPQAWLVRRWEDARTVLAHTAASTDLTRPGYPARSPAVLPRGFFLFQDDPVHDVFRKVLAREFVVRKIEALREPTTRVLDGLLRQMVEEGEPADFVESVALPLPSLVISELLGVPYDDHEFFQEHSRVLIDSVYIGEQKAAAQRALGDYLEALVVERRVRPRDDLISRLGQHVDAGTFTVRDAADVGSFLLFAGHETTANMIGLGVLALLENPEQIPVLHGNPAAAVEELLRYLTIAQSGVSRVVTEDVVLGDVTIRAGEGVIVMLNSANRDEAVFPGGGELDLARPNARQHLAFGYGVHQCLGKPLARMELQVVLPEVLRRLPGLRIADGQQVVYKHTASAYGPARMPVAWL